MSIDLIAFIIIAAVLTAIYFLARKGRRSGEEERQKHLNEANRLLGELNKSFGAPEGTGFKATMNDGQFRVVNVGHEERIRTEPAYAFGNEMAGIVWEMNNLEEQLKEAQSKGDVSLARAISNELKALGLKANTMMDAYEREKAQRQSE